MRAMPASSRMTDLDSTRTYPIRAPWTRHSSHRGNFANPRSTFLIHDHSFIHACMHSYIYPYIHPIHPSIAYAIVASQRFASRHETAVVSFNMNDNRPGFEGRPTKGSRPPRVKQSQGKNIDEPRAALAQSALKQIGSSQHSRSILTSSHAHGIFIEGEASGPPGSVSGMTQASARTRVME